MTPLEALADAIMSFEGWAPSSRSWRNRNPGNLRSGVGMVGSDAGYAVFPSLAVGFAALTTDLADKCCGRTSTGLGPSSTLQDLMNVYAPATDANNPGIYAKFVASRMSEATGQTFTTASTLASIVSA